MLSRSYYRTLSGDKLATALDEGATVTAARAAQEEWRAFLASFQALHDDGPFVPNVPITSISSNRILDEKGRENRDFLGSAQRKICEYASDGRHVYSDGRSHYLQFTEPKLVANEIQLAVSRVCG
ncbi:hypothetical protein Rhow_008151 [Rhodococcus wratislaviensis]|uniref:Uncharacterized protein n=1 Tax=Rhodococcus wratislaviensis TaxID=44752 RepID=A0A402CJS7_RHOWR|nr:hypothetical protein Rhow_008151 [Rhodococcus wratislaviensis]